jgi:hypothetical protein
MPLLTRFQKFALGALALLMAADLAISTWGVLYSPVFSEANALFARFVHEPLQFITVIGLSKVAVIAGIILATVWFNLREPAGEPWHGGDIICSTAAFGMAALLGTLIVGNLLLV